MTWKCGPGPNQLWRINPDGYMINKDGKCLGKGAPLFGSTGDSTNALVIGECGGASGWPQALRFLFAANVDSTDAGKTSKGGGGGGGRIMTADNTSCVRAMAAGGQGGEVRVVLSTQCAASDLLVTWAFTPTDIGGADSTWRAWFDPCVV